MNVEYNKQVINLLIHVPWAFSFLQRFSASSPMLNTSKVKYAQKTPVWFVGNVMKDGPMS
jgi:hypothetical protein